MNLIGEIFGWIFIGFFQALFAILRPLRDPDLIRIQRWAGGLLLVGSAALGIFVLSLFFWRDWRLLAGSFAVWVVATLFAGALGGCLEK